MTVSHEVDPSLEWDASCFSQIENSTDGNVFLLAEIFTHDCLEVRPKQNEPVKLVKEDWRSGIQSKFLNAALKKKCQTQTELAYTND